jgi:hypothetical protein
MDKLSQPHESVDALAEKVKEIEIDQSKLTALSPEVISRQATVSPIGGKSQSNQKLIYICDIDQHR